MKRLLLILAVLVPLSLVSCEDEPLTVCMDMPRVRPEAKGKGKGKAFCAMSHTLLTEEQPSETKRKMKSQAFRTLETTGTAVFSSFTIDNSIISF